MVSGSISLRYSRFFSPFPHGTGSLSVSQEYLALADGPAYFIQGFTCPALLRILLWFMFFTYTGLSPSMATLSLSLIHISEPTRLRRISYAVFCLKTNKTKANLVCRLLLA